MLQLRTQTLASTRCCRAARVLQGAGKVRRALGGVDTRSVTRMQPPVEAIGMSPAGAEAAMSGLAVSPTHEAKPV